MTTHASMDARSIRALNLSIGRAAVAYLVFLEDRTGSPDAFLRLPPGVDWSVPQRMAREVMLASLLREDPDLIDVHDAAVNALDQLGPAWRSCPDLIAAMQHHDAAAARAVACLSLTLLEHGHDWHDTAESVRRLRVNMDTGLAVWRDGRRAGKVAGCLGRKGYRRIRLGVRARLAHHVVHLQMTGRWPAGLIDHRDGDAGNNAPANLREVTDRANQQHQTRAHKGSTSQHLGVSWHKRHCKWQAYIRDASGRGKHLGYYVREIDAAVAYERAKAFHHAGHIPASAAADEAGTTD